MEGVISKILPVIFIFILGYILKSIKLLKSEDADRFMKLVFYVAAPSLILTSLMSVDLSLFAWSFPVIVACNVLITFLVSYAVSRVMELERKTAGVLVAGTMIMNCGMLIPFFYAGYGSEGLAKLLMFDLFNAVMVFTLIYYMACSYGGNKRNYRDLIKKLVSSPPLWSIILGIALNLLGLSIPGIADNLFHYLGEMNVPLVMLSLGIYFNPKIVRGRLVLIGILTRMGIGFFMGMIYISVFRLQGLEMIVALIASSAPVGYNTLTFASLENLDKEFAATLVSFSILIGMILVPILMMIL